MKITKFHDYQYFWLAVPYKSNTLTVIGFLGSQITNRNVFIRKITNQIVVPLLLDTLDQ
jgi:hypothetical protein